MSDAYVDEALTDGPVGDGQADVGIADTSNDVPILNVDEFAGYRIPVKVDGQEEFIPLEEARAGYQRQADYTRKTQELAQQRSELGWAAAMKAALDQDPQGTLSLLQAHYGVQTPAPQPVPQMSQDPFDDWLSNDDGWQQTQQDPRVAALEARLARIEQMEQEAQLKSDIARLQSTYPDFDPVQVVAEAVRRNSSDLEGVYKQIAFDRVYGTKSQLEQQLAAFEQARTAKQQASVVSGGSSVQTGGLDPVGEITNIRDAWEAAKRQLSK